MMMMMVLILVLPSNDPAGSIEAAFFGPNEKCDQILSFTSIKFFKFTISTTTIDFCALQVLPSWNEINL